MKIKYTEFHQKRLKLEFLLEVKLKLFGSFMEGSKSTAKAENES